MQVLKNIFQQTNQNALTLNEIMHGYDVVSQLYPYVPPINMWRAFEYAAYSRYKLAEPMLDIGCGDGAFLKLVWPSIKKVTGIDISPEAVQLAKNSGVYSDVHLCAADKLALPPSSFASAFANCSLEHMDNLPTILTNVHRSLKPSGKFLLSVVTEKFIEWSPLPLLIKEMGEQPLSAKLLTEHIRYHHLVNPLPIETWKQELEKAGFKVLHCIPILPELISKLFLFMDSVWHVKNPTGEIGDGLTAYCQNIPNFPQLFRHIFQTTLQMETNWDSTSGVIFWVEAQ